MEYPHWPYLRGMVGDTLKDPTHGGRIQREIGQQLDTLGHQLVLDCVSVNLQETKRTSERRGVTHTHQAGLEVHGWIRWKQPASSVYLKTKYTASFPCHPAEQLWRSVVQAEVTHARQ